MTDRIKIVDTDIRLHTVETRLPFEFGIATMERMPHCFVRATVEVDGETATGIAADHFPPKWFTKKPDQSLESEIADLQTVVEQACQAAEGTRGSTPFDCWYRVYEHQEQWASGTEYPPLLWGFGVTFVERALIDAYCRLTGQSFPEAVAAAELGTDPSKIYPSLESLQPADVIPDPPLETVKLRHTVGHDDPLSERPPDAPTDGLPVTLTETIEEYGVSFFKLKIGGDVEADHRRLADVLEVLEQHCESYSFTLDANEQYRSVADLQALFERLETDPRIPAFTESLLFVEQPFPRDIALTDAVGDQLRSWDDGPPIIIDESDGELDSFGRSLELGYAGTSYKSCKGVFKGLVNACLAAERRAQGETAVISGEDLTTIGPVSVQQDLAVMGTLGIEHVERNGHHYFKGLSMFDDGIQDAVREANPDLFKSHDDGYVTLAVSNGELQIGSTLTAPFGTTAQFDLDNAPTPEEWSFDPPSES